MASNYKDRSVDLVAWHGIKLNGQVTLSQCLFSSDTPSEVCAGIQKLIQRWLTIFLTPKGSVKFDKERGTDFMLDIYTACTENEVYTMFLLQNSYAVTQLRAEEDDTMPDDERIGSVTLTGLDLFLGNLSLHITITSREGDRVNVILPIATNPMAL